VGWIDAELVLVALAAMLSPTTLGFSVLALVMGDRPRRTGLWFYLGALTATLAVGVVAAFVIGDVAASDTPSQPKTWVHLPDRWRPRACRPVKGCPDGANGLCRGCLAGSVLVAGGGLALWGADPR
jgi:hypothetical protein